MKKAETKLYYHGARYYNPSVSVWLSVDAMASKYPNLSPYNFVANNPIKYIDPDGNRIVVPKKGSQKLVLSLLADQLGQGLFKFNKKGKLKLNNKAFKNAMKSTNFNAEQKQMLGAMKTTIKDKKTLTVFTAKNATKMKEYVNPQAYDPSTGEMKDEFPGGVDIGPFSDPTLDAGIIDVGSMRALTYFEDGANNATYSSGSSNTKKSGSSILMHEILDHFYEEDINGKSTQRAKINQVFWHNKALDNKNAGQRDGIDH